MLKRIRLNRKIMNIRLLMWLQVILVFNWAASREEKSTRGLRFIISLEAMVFKESFVRAINAFVNAIDLESFGFTHVCCKEDGRLPYLTSPS